MRRQKSEIHGIAAAGGKDGKSRPPGRIFPKGGIKIQKSPCGKGHSADSRRQLAETALATRGVTSVKQGFFEA